jgi:hypothetical protein
VRDPAQRPPPIADECPAVAYVVEVNRRSDHLIVSAKLTHCMPDGTLKRGIGSWDYPDPLTANVYEPCWLLRLLGDTIEARLERAKRLVARHAEHEIAKQRRITDIAERCV